MTFLKLILKWGSLLAIWLAIILTVILFYYFKGLPSLGALGIEGNKQIVSINYQNGDRITSRGQIYRDKVYYYELPQNLINAVIATEDRRFFTHHGVDIFGILRAYIANYKAGRVVQGGSTITQQLAKMQFLTPERTMQRKIQEIMLALQLESKFSKEEIITFYLNRAYFGSGNYGVSHAAKNYFGKDISDLNLNEAAMLAGLLKAPSKLSPKNNLELAQERSHIVLSNMINAGFLTEKNLMQIDQDPNYKIDHAQKLYFADYAYGQFTDFLDEESAAIQKISITTTLNETIQEKLEDELDAFVLHNAKKLKESQIAMVVMNKEGAILAMSGGRDYGHSQFNRAVHSKRQAGSSFKTFAYLAAFEAGFAPNDIYEDKEIQIGNWIPKNYDNRYFGDVSLAEAFAKSLNSVAVQVAQKTGSKAIATIARQCGIVSKIDQGDLTIVLGTTEVSLLELTAAYATIANDGQPVLPYAISKMTDDKNNVLYQRQSSGFKSLISARSAQNIKLVLRQVVEDGTGKRANIANNIYGKTGTSQDFRDAWFVGFDDKYIVGVWIGNDNNSATNRITGGSLPAALFAKVIGRI